MLTVCFGLSAHALDFKCPIVDAMTPSDWPSESLVISTASGETESSVASMTYVHVIPEGNGEFSESLETLYSVDAPHSHGEHSVKDCDPLMAMNLSRVEERDGTLVLTEIQLDEDCAGDDMSIVSESLLNADYNETSPSGHYVHRSQLKDGTLAERRVPFVDCRHEP